MKFFTINQNNSGGYFIQNNNVDQLVCVEAKNAEVATKILQNIVEGYSDYCECCGERWYISLDDNYCTYFINDGYGCDISEKIDVSEYRQNIIIHYMDGVRKKYNAKTKEYTIIN